MAATFAFGEDNGAATGSPSKGTTRNTSRSECNYKNIDDSSSAYSSYPIVAGTNSYSKYQFGIFSGSYNQVLNCKWSAHTSPAGALATGLTLKGTVSSTYATPATAANAALTTDFTTAVAIGSGLSVNLATSGPEAAAPGSTLSAGGGYTQYLVSQLQTTTGAAPGDMATITQTLQYDEN